MPIGLRNRIKMSLQDMAEKGGTLTAENFVHKEAWIMFEPVYDQVR
jgi:hypothetical protein